jgi:hypothetical protein
MITTKYCSWKSFEVRPNGFHISHFFVCVAGALLVKF